MPRAETTTIGVPMPSARAVSISFQPSSSGEHQVEHADVGVLVAEPREPELAAADDERVEAGRREVPRHAVGDHGVVLDDQDLRHGCLR